MGVRGDLQPVVEQGKEGCQVQAATEMGVKPNCRTRRKRRKRSREGQTEMAASTAASHSPVPWGVDQPFSLLLLQAAQGESSFLWGTLAVPASPQQLSLSQCLSALPSPRPVPTISRCSSSSPFEPQQLLLHNPGCLLHHSPSSPALLVERSLCLFHQHFSFLEEQQKGHHVLCC